MTCGNSNVFCVKISRNGKTLGANEPFSSAAILVTVKFSFYRIRDKMHLHGNNILKPAWEAEESMLL